MDNCGKSGGAKPKMNRNFKPLQTRRQNEYPLQNSILQKNGNYQSHYVTEQFGSKRNINVSRNECDRNVRHSLLNMQAVCPSEISVRMALPDLSGAKPRRGERYDLCANNSSFHNSIAAQTSAFNSDPGRLKYTRLSNLKEQDTLLKLKDKEIARASSDDVREVLKCHFRMLEKKKHTFLIETESLVNRLDDNPNHFNMLRKELLRSSDVLNEKCWLSAYRNDILQALKSSQVLIVAGEKGYGKSSLLPLYASEICSELGIVVSCQLDQVAVLALAKHLALLLGTSVGKTVGYKLGTDNAISTDTNILIVTNHLLLREMLDNPFLSKYSCLILDDCHNRSVETIVLLYKAKEILQLRPYFKLIIISSHLDDRFEKFFSKERIVTISLPRITFPVNVNWNNLRNPNMYLEKVIELVQSIHHRNKSGNVLVFVTTLEKAHRACALLEQKLKNDVLCFILHSKTSINEIDKIFSNDPRRIVIFCTECAESLSLPNINFVIDSGKIKEKIYDVDKRQSIISASFISRERAESRRKLAGHIQGGCCYRLYTENTYCVEMPEKSLSALSKMNPGNLLLTLLHFNMAISSSADFIYQLENEMLKVGSLVLENCGATRKGTLTKLGRSMALLPFEPNYNKLVALGIENGLSFETVMIAVLSSLNVPIFNTRDQSKDIGKHCFYDPDGDYFAIFNVYSEWKKNNFSKTWCIDNGINHSSLISLHKKLKAVLTSLNIKDCNPQIKLSRRKLIELICNSFSENLCIYTGHFRLGYRSLQTDNILHIHNSSTFCYRTNEPPQYVVYDYPIEHSNIDFMINVTPVPAYMMQTMLRDCHAKGKPNLDHRMDFVVIEPVGEMVIKQAILGKAGRNLKVLEKEIKRIVGCDVIIIDPKVECGKIELYTYPQYLKPARDTLLRHIEVYLETLKCQEEEMTMPVGNAVMKILCGQGGMLTNVSGIVNKNSIKEKASPNQESMCSIMHKCSILLTWRRRLCKGSGYVTLSSATDFDKAYVHMLSGELKACEKTVKVSVSRKESYQFFIDDLLPQTTNEDLKDAVQKHTNVRVKDATTTYSPPFSSSEVDLLLIKEALLLQFIRYVQYGEVDVHVETPSSSDVFMKAYLNFDNCNDVGVVLRAVARNEIKTFQDVPLNYKEVYRMTIFCIPEQYNAVEKAIEASLQTYENSHDQSSKNSNKFKFTKRTHNDKMQLKLLSNSYDVMQKCEKIMMDSLKGKELQGFSANQLRKLFSHSGQQWLKQTEKTLDCFILKNCKQKTLSICGTWDNYCHIQSKINDYLNCVENETMSVISMEEKGFNRQVIKNLIIKYGIKLEGFVVECDLTSVEFNIQYCQLTLHGTPDSIKKAENILKSLANQSQTPLSNYENEEECPVCFTHPVFGSSYRLQFCGHQYCSDCVRLLVAERLLPLKCCKEGCQKELVIEDVLNALEGNEEETERLLYHALNVYVEKNNEYIKFCPTPDCNVVYDLRLLTVENSSLWTCPACGKVICINCNIEEHPGILCDMAKKMKQNIDSSLEAWMTSNSKSRKHCPNCNAPIEKNGGCNHMECWKCHGHFCWLCLQAFRDGAAVYNHLPYCSQNQMAFD